jgi:hypothetical protein
LPLITQADAQMALDEIATDSKKFSIIGKPDVLCAGVTVYFVRVWDGEDVDFYDVMFHNRNGKVKVYEGNN